MIKGVIFDYGRTLADPDTHQLFSNSLEVLEKLKKMDLKMAVVSRAANPKQRSEEFKQFKLDRYFQVFDVVPREGTKEFTKVLDELGLKSEDCAVVGDRIKSEIVEGNKIGLTTIWLKQGLFANELPKTPEEEPDYTINSLEELIPVIESLI